MRWIWLFALAATGCASTVSSSGYYASYHDAVESYAARAVLEGPYASAPNRVRAEYAECAADFMVARLAPEEKSSLDAFVQGKQTMSLADYKAKDTEIETRVGGPLTYATIDRLGSTCPQALPDFRQYFGPGFNGL